MGNYLDQRSTSTITKSVTDRANSVIGQGPWRDVLYAVGGLVGVVLGLAVIHNSGFVQTAFVLAGFYGLFLAIKGTGRRIFGDRFDAGLCLAVGWLLLIVALALLAGVLPFGQATDPAKALTAPILARPDLFSRHPLGTNRQGLDLVGELAYGARVSLIVGIGAVVIAMAIGGCLGVVAGYLRGTVDRVVTIGSDALLAFPPLVLLLGLSAVLTPNVSNEMIALAIVSMPACVRLARANAIRFAKEDFVAAAEIVGSSRTRVMLREVFPNVSLPLVTYGILIVGVVMVAEAGLGFLGLGIQPPTPTWGNMIASGEPDFQQYPYLVLVPGCTLFLTILSLNRLAEWVRIRWDVRQSRVDVGGRKDESS